MQRLRAAGLDRDRRATSCIDRTAFDLPAHDPAAFDGEPLKPYNVGPDALLVNFKSAALVFAPDRGNRSRAGAPRPAAGGASASARRRSTARAAATGAPRCGRASTTTGASRRCRSAARYPAACGERDWWVALLDPPHYAHAMFTLYFRAAGGQFAGGARRAPRAAAGARPLAVLESPPLYDIVRDVNKFSNNVMARQIFLTLALEAAPPPATPAKAADVVRRFLALRRIALPKLVMENGSGLSRNERITAGGPRAPPRSRPTQRGARGVRELARRCGDGRHGASGASRPARRPDRRCSRPARSKACARSRATCSTRKAIATPSPRSSTTRTRRAAAPRSTSSCNGSTPTRRRMIRRRGR